MIRVIFAAAALCASLVASAAPVAPAAAQEPVSFSFGAVSLVDFAQATYRNLLKRDFVLSSELVSLNKRITVSVKALPAERIREFIDQVLSSQGVSVAERNGIFFLDVAQGGNTGFTVPAEVSPAAPGAGLPAPDPDQVRVLVAMNRPVELLVESLNAVFGGSVARPAGGARFALVVSDKRLPLVLEVAKQLDVAAVSVEVSASFVEVSRNGQEARGLALVAGALSNNLAVSVKPGDGVLSVSGGGYQLVLDALAGDGRFKQVSNSRLVGDEAQRVSLSVGDETPTIASTSLDANGRQVQSVQYRPSGVILDVVPKVLGSGRLSLLVDGQVSSFQATQTGVAGSPTLIKRQVKTSVSVNDGQVLVIGGLDDSQVSSSTAGFSFFPAAWRNRAGSDRKTDLVLILSARVLPSDVK